MSEAETFMRNSGTFEVEDPALLDSSSDSRMLGSLRFSQERKCYEVEPTGCVVTVFHQSIIVQLLNPQHPLYEVLRSGDPHQVWLGPAQAPLRVLFSADRVDGGPTQLGLPARAYAFADFGDEESERRAERARRLLDHRPGGGSGSKSQLTLPVVHPTQYQAAAAINP
jgi:hypothetical protein